MQENERQPKDTETVYEQFLNKAETGGRDVDEFLATEPEENRRNHHRDSGNTESPSRAETRIMEEERARDGGDE